MPYLFDALKVERRDFHRLFTGSLLLQICDENYHLLDQLFDHFLEKFKDNKFVTENVKMIKNDMDYDLNYLKED